MSPGCAPRKKILFSCPGYACPTEYTDVGSSTLKHEQGSMSTSYQMLIWLDPSLIFVNSNIYYHYTGAPERAFYYPAEYRIVEEYLAEHYMVI